MDQRSSFWIPARVRPSRDIHSIYLSRTSALAPGTVPVILYLVFSSCGVINIVTVQEELKYRVLSGVMLIPRWVISQLPRESKIE